jgi:D-alanyl-D-alanine carboxypeptidase
VAGGGYVREVVIDDLRAMARAARRNGTPLVSWSPYRGYRQQEKLFEGYARGYGFDEAVTFSARPGHSEHQLGLAIDFVAVGDDGLTSNWEKTATGAWMARNAWKYGWLMSYPKGKSAATCYSYEPWHYRYVGRELAAEIHASGLTIREYLWANYTIVDPTTGEPLPTATVGPSTPTSPSTSPGVTPTPAGPTSGPGRATPSPARSPAATEPPTSEAGSWFGFDPAVVVASLLLVLASIGLIASLGFRRSQRG